MKRVVCWMAVALIMISASVVSHAEGSPLAEALEKHARTEAARLQVIKQEKDYWEIFTDMEECREVSDMLDKVDFTEPQAMAIFLASEEKKIDLLHRFKRDNINISDALADAACSRLYVLPVDLAGEFGARWPWTQMADFMAVDQAFSIPELDGVAYVIQYFGKENALIVTSVMTTEHPIALSHTEFLYSVDLKNTEAALLSMIATYFGEDLDVTVIEFESSLDG